LDKELSVFSNKDFSIPTLAEVLMEDDAREHKFKGGETHALTRMFSFLKEEKKVALFAKPVFYLLTLPGNITNSF
jgi:hypothetical protein